MAINKRLLVKPPSTGITPSEHFGVVLYEGDGSSSHSINGGKFGAAGYFNGSSSAIVNTSFGISGNQARSYSAWVYTNGSTTGTICGVGNNGVAGQSMYLFIDQPTSTWSMWGFTATYDLENQSLAAIGNLSDGWHHFVLTWDASSTFKLYIDGSLADTKTKSVTYNTPAEFAIGRWYDSGYWFDGKIDQVRIFSSALTSSEVSTLYAETVDTVESLDPLNVDTTDTLQVLGDSSCIATYRFENNEDDLSGNYDGTGTAIQYAAGRYGQAASFNVSTSRVELASTIATTLRTAAAFGISCWIKPSTGNSFGEVVHLLNDIYILIAYKSDNKIEARIYNSSVVLSSVITSSTYDLDVWHHIVWTADTNGANLYVNNAFEGTASWDGTFDTYSNSTYKHNLFGSNSLTGGSPFYGSIDQVRIFNKALSAAEVTTLYNENPLVASYRFEGNANDDMRAYDGTATNVTYEYGLNFTPDFVWLKDRSDTFGHRLIDSSTGTDKYLESSSTNSQQGASGNGLISFDTGGFTVGSGNAHNKDGDDFVAWAWKANGGTTSSNTDGNVTSTVQVNNDAKFSLIQWTGTAPQHIVGHGLGVKPSIVFLKRTDSSNDWLFYYDVVDGSLDFAYLNQTTAGANSSRPVFTSDVFYWAGGGDYIGYAFAEVEGFSSFGSYTGNGSDNGPIIETGFEPAFIMFKQTDDVANWCIVDNKRSTTNPRNKTLRANSSVSEATVGSTQLVVDFLSNGFQLKQSGGNNVNNGNFIYMAFAADPDTEAPTVAKSFFATTYDGTGADGNSITGFGFKPGLLWLKRRNSTADHWLFDIVRGPFKLLESSTSDAENNRTTSVASFDDDGFTIDNDTAYNNTSDDYISWAWKADDNEPTINTEGSVDSVVSANANSGFSIVKWDGTGAINTVGHGLSAAPELILIKTLDQAGDWQVYSEPTGNGNKLVLNSSAAASSTTRWDSTSPTSTVFTLRDIGLEGGLIAYCFHSVSGYSKIGSYSGTGSAGNAQNVGFTPDWLMVKRYVGSASQWIIIDSVRGTKALYADLANTESSESRIFLNSTGFEFTGSAFNESSTEWIYMAFKIN